MKKISLITFLLGLALFTKACQSISISNFTLNSTTLSTTCGSLTNINNFAPILFNATTNVTPSQYKIEIKAINASCNPITGAGLINYVGSWISGAPPSNWDISSLTGANGIKLSNTIGKVKITYFVKGGGCNNEHSLSKNINLVGPPTSITITGPACYNGSSYGISSTPTIPANSNVIWTVTPSGSANPTGNGTTTCTLNPTISQGAITLTATLNGTVVATKVINLGYPFSLYPAIANPPEAGMETGEDEGPCNSQCYSPTGSTYKWWNAPIANNTTSDTWQKLVSYPINYSYWSPGTNQIGLYFKAANQSVEFRRTLTNSCGSVVEYYCFTSTTSLCSGLRVQTPITTNLKVYPNPVNSNKTISIEIVADDKTIKTSFENCLIQLLDGKENVIYQKQGRNIDTESIDIPSLSNGKYYLRVVNSNGFQTEQIIIKN